MWVELPESVVVAELEGALERAEVRVLLHECADGRRGARLAFAMNSERPALAVSGEGH